MSQPPSERALRRGRGSFAERELRLRLTRFLCRNWRLIGGLAVVFIAAGSLARIWFHGYLLGVAHGFLIASAIALVYLTYLLVTGQSFRLAGTWGEDNTRDVLRGARRRRHIYDWIDNLEVDGGDIDHLVLAASGVFALDSKWHTAEIDERLVHKDVAAARSAARRARLILRAEKHSVDVTPIVVVWGGRQGELPTEGLLVEGVRVLQGRALRDWLQAQGRAAGDLDRAKAQAMTHDLLLFRHRVRPAARKGH